MITDVPGIRVGHWTNEVAQTGCTVILTPPGTIASGEVRGGAPGTREFELLQPGRTMQRLDAVVLTGGSSFGLASCDGVMRWCAERDIGLPTAGGVVPIVVGMVLFDLLVGDGSVRPTAADGYAASEAASDGPIATGRVGAGTGATYAKWRGREFRKPGGLGTATVRDGDVIVSALVAVNALGERRPAASGTPVPAPFMENTTIGVVATNAKLTKLQCHLLAQSAHDGLARALEPAHSAGDGDAFVVLATAAVDADLPLEPIRIRAAQAVEHAIAKVTSEA